MLVSVTATAQPGTITGRVVDAATGDALPGVNVFLSQTTRGAATDTDGRFTIARIPEGEYVLVASMLGYERVEQPVRAGAPLDLEIRLREVTSRMGEARVVSTIDRRWRRHLRRFERLFFGPTPRGRRCRFLNPEVLDFTEPRGAFVASARAPLVFENEALGYRVTYVLDRFRADGETVMFGGYPRYEDLDGDDCQRDRWQTERAKAYRGSVQHFLRALATRSAGAEGFDAYVLPDLDVPRGRPAGPAFVPRVAFDSLLTWGSSGPELTFEGVLHVEYTRERPRRDFPQARGWASQDHQHSALTLHAPSVPFDPLGHFYQPYLTQRYGYWSWEGHIGDLLPLDYRLPPDL